MFALVWTGEAAATFARLQQEAEQALASRTKSKRTRASKQEGLFKQVVKCIDLLAANPRHPGPQTHEFHSIENPYDPGQKVFEAYAQNRTPGAHRVVCCYGPEQGEITIIAITPHP